MFGNRVPVRPAMTRPVTVRRSMVGGEIKIYQELIRIAAERRRILAEQEMWAKKRQGIEGEVRAINDYRKELFRKLEQYHGDCPGSPRTKPDEEKEQEGPPGGGGHGVMELRF